MSLIKFKVREWYVRPEVIEYSRETAHYYVRPNGGRDAKVSRYYVYFDTEAEALQHIAERQQAEQAAKRLRQIEAAASDLLEALEWSTFWLEGCLKCDAYVWDDDQREAAEENLKASKAAIAKATGGNL